MNNYRKPLVLLSALIVVAAVASPVGATAVTVRITADNAYSYGFGTVDTLGSIQDEVQNCGSSGITGNGPTDCTCGGGSGVGPETYVIPAGPDLGATYIYIMAWADASVNQGLIAEFSQAGGATISTQPGFPWEVYSTGDTRTPNCSGSTGCGTPGADSGPDLVNIQGHITDANDGDLWENTSGGSVGTGRLEFGEDNSAGGLFPVVCDFPQDSQWMWRNPDPNTIPDPFDDSSLGAQEYLIFRIGPLGDLPGITAFGADHEVCYRVKKPTFEPPSVFYTDQFGKRIPVTFHKNWRFLCTPATKCVPDASCIGKKGEDLTCSDGILDAICCEECDDGNAVDGDGCTNCTLD